MNPFLQYTEVDDFTSALYIDDNNRQLVLRYDGSFILDDSNQKSLFSVVNNIWKNNSWLRDMEGPYMIWTGCCGPIEPLDSFKLHPTMIDNFKSNGLTIILYEPLSTYRQMLKNRFIDHLNYDQFEDNGINLKIYSSYELDSIQRFAERINYEGKIKVYTCNYQVQKYFGSRYKNLDLYCRDIFLSTDSHSDVSFENHWNQKIPHRRFICLNRRYTGVRHMAMLYLASTKNFYTGTYSWNVQTDIGYLDDKLWFTFSNWKTTQPDIYKRIDKGIEILNEIVPLTLDDKMPQPFFIGEDGRKDPPPSDWRIPLFAYAEAFAAIVTETRFAEPMPNFSEKTTNAIKGFRPFVLFAPPRTLEFMHRLGFKTFGEFWDESYDQETNHEQRMLKIFKVIDHIDNLSHNDVKYTLEKMQPILQHNAEVLGKLAYGFPEL